MMNTEPDYEAAFGLIKHLSSDELRDLINHEEKMLDLIKDLPQMKNLQSEKEMLLASNKSLAEYNLSFEPKLVQEKQALISKYDISSEVLKQVNSMKKEIDTSSKKETPESICLLIKKAAQEREEDTENLVKSFLNNDPSVEDFLEEFLPNRASAHLAKIKAEKIKELLSKNRNSQNSLFQPPVVTTPWSAPYPSNLPNMPMPSYSIP